MKQQDISHRAGRRSFFKKVAILSGTTFLTVLGRRAQATTFSDRPEKPRKQGYRLTPHIRKYYEKASF